MATMVLSSIPECRKALEFLHEKRKESGIHVELKGVPCPARIQDSNAMPNCLGHQLILQGDNKLKCQFCGKEFHSKHQALTREDYILFGSLDPKIPFGRLHELIREHS